MKDNLGRQTLESMNQADLYNKWTFDKLKPYLTGKILEIGCGIGNFTETLMLYGQVWAIDINKNYIKQTKNLVGDKVVVGIGNIENGEYFFKHEKFDSIVCINVLEHIENDLQAIKNMNEILKKGGNLILLIPAHPFLFGEIDRSIGHFKRYTKIDILNKLEKNGFKIIKFRQLNFLGAIGWFISGKILKNKTVDKSKIKIFNIFAPIFLKIEDLIEPFIGTSFLIIAKK